MVVASQVTRSVRSRQGPVGEKTARTLHDVDGPHQKEHKAAQVVSEGRGS
jgi:hypothetical protein